MKNVDYVDRNGKEKRTLYDSNGKRDINMTMEKSNPFLFHLSNPGLDFGLTKTPS